MHKYIFSLISRLVVAVSGFLVFIITSKLFGAEGRGVIGYGTSIVSIFSLILSFNLGRVFLLLVQKSDKRRSELIDQFILMQIILTIAAIVFIANSWIFFTAVQKIFDAQTMLVFLILTPYYLWSVNGSVIYASFRLTFKQDVIILITRIFLVLSLVLMWIYELKSLDFFLLIYGCIIGGGALVEMLVIASPRRAIKLIGTIRLMPSYLKLSFWTHADFLSFYTFPLFLMVISGLYMSRVDLGRLNFSIQLVSFIFIYAFVASLRIKSYISFEGSRWHSAAIFKILIGTLVLSLLSFIGIYILLKSAFFHAYFPSFDDASLPFLIMIFSVPGYVAYQFGYPVLIEINKIKLPAAVNIMNMLFFILIAFLAIPRFGLIGACCVFSLFHVSILFIQLYFYWLYSLKTVGGR